MLLVLQPLQMRSLKLALKETRGVTQRQIWARCEPSSHWWAAQRTLPAAMVLLNASAAMHVSNCRLGLLLHGMLLVVQLHHMVVLLQHHSRARLPVALRSRT